MNLTWLQESIEVLDQDVDSWESNLLLHSRLMI